MNKLDLINVVLKCTAKFQERFDSDSKPDEKKRQIILDSEVNETIQAIKDNDLVEILDGYCDIIYVLGGSVDKFKHDKNQSNLYLDWINVRLEQALKYFSLECIFDAFYDVHRSNMSKIHKNLHSVFDTVKKYQLDTNDFRLKKVSENEYLVYDNKINKLLKPEKYTKANLKPILKKYGYIS
jgi:predicted HAD superfamily Cof-like phosphohydrolase